MGEDLGVLADEEFDTSRLTSRQRAVLTAIRDWAIRYGYPPSTREIADTVGLASTSSVSRHLRALEDLVEHLAKIPPEAWEGAPAAEPDVASRRRMAGRRSREAIARAARSISRRI